MGRAKALLTLHGQTLLARTLATAGAADLEPVLVVPPGDNPVAAEAARLGARVVSVGDPSDGMSASIRAGIEALSADPAVDGVLILLADQWRLAPADLQRLAEAWRQSPSGLAAAFYAGGAGVPAVFGRAWFPVLMRLTGDRGARDILRCAHPPAALVHVAAAEADIDTPTDLAAAKTEQCE